MMLGAVTCVLEPENINSCAFGAALNAMGVEREAPGNGVSRYWELKQIWPWLCDPAGGPALSVQACGIYQRFDWNVCRGEMTLEELVDYVRSIEPDCDCCRFNCDCAKTAEQVTEVLHVQEA